mmetsp:Transcript_20304/g.51457  ORF Transcript_20304/g.51457 Transcript_20304/m.51457 type:complete len:215 (-) Transcript_20304:308-952(-)
MRARAWRQKGKNSGTSSSILLPSSAASKTTAMCIRASCKCLCVFALRSACSRVSTRRFLLSWLARAISWSLISSPESPSSKTISAMLTCAKRARTLFSSPCSTLSHSVDVSTACCMRRCKSATHCLCFSWSLMYSANALACLVTRLKLPFNQSAPGCASSSISQTDTFPMQHATSNAVNGRLKSVARASADTPFESSCRAMSSDASSSSRKQAS